MVVGTKTFRIHHVFNGQLAPGPQPNSQPCFANLPYSLTSAANRFHPRIHDGHGDGVRPPLLQPGFFDFNFKFLNDRCLIKLFLLIYLVTTPARANENEFISNLILNVELQARARQSNVSNSSELEANRRTPSMIRVRPNPWRGPPESPPRKGTTLRDFAGDKSLPISRSAAGDGGPP